MPLPFDFDYQNPDYATVLKWRMDRLSKIRAHRREDPLIFEKLKAYYRTHSAQFIIDWGVTYDPRLVTRGLPAIVPFLLFPRQEEWVGWFEEIWRNDLGGLTPKSREIGASEMACALAATHALLHDNLTIGFGSRKQEYIDASSKPNSLFGKMRRFINGLPVEFRGGHLEKKHNSLMKIFIPDTGSFITGEAGDNIGRGDRTSYYHVDESAFLARPDLVEGALSQTTRCRHDLSTPKGPNNPFARKVRRGILPVFRFHWTDDPRKNQKWYEEECRKIDDPVIVAQELDIDFDASVDGIIIPKKWVDACLDAHIKLGLSASGVRRSALDVADEGKDKNAIIVGHGSVLTWSAQWTGKDSDIYATTEKAFKISERTNVKELRYDADGLGAGVRGDARKINTQRKEAGIYEIDVYPFRGSGAVSNPDKEAFPQVAGEGHNGARGRTNGDYYQNAKAQSWDILKRRIRKTYRAVVEGESATIDDILSISSDMPGYESLMRELSQPQWKESATGKILVDKAPDGMPSPNLADACMIYFAKLKRRQGFFT